MVVGWYHSHPGFGCWLSGVDINTQQVVYYLYSYCFSMEDFMLSVFILIKPNKLIGVLHVKECADELFQ